MEIGDAITFNKSFYLASCTKYIFVCLGSYDSFGHPSFRWTIFDYLKRNCLKNEPKNNMHFCLKSLKLDNMPSVRYKMI